METIEINGVHYYTATDAAKAIQKSYKTIMYYLNVGNEIKKLDSLKVGYARYVAVDALHAYPFTRRGKNSVNRVYHYDKNFNEVPCEECSKGNYKGCKHTY